MGVVILFLHLGIVNQLVLNLWGFNAPNKQEDVKILCNDKKVSLIGLLETKKRERNLIS